MPPGQPVAVSSGGRTHVFAIAAGGGLNHWMTNDGSWSGPSLLPGGNLAPSFPCAIALPDGSVNVFAIGFGGACPLVRWSSPDGTLWGNPQLCPFLPIPGGGNGLATASMDGKQIDVFAVTAGGIVQYSFIPGLPIPGMALLPDSAGLPTRLLAAVSSAPGKLDVFAVDPNLHMPLHWRFNGTWSKQLIGVPGLANNSGIAAVSTEPGRVELFGIAADGTMWSCAVTGMLTVLKPFAPQFIPPGSWALPDGVPAVVAGGGKIDLFAIGKGDLLKGGPLVHWRYDGTWGEPGVYDASIAPGGVSALKGAFGIDAFAFQWGNYNNVLLHWPAGPWRNWAENRKTDPVEGHWYPMRLDELVAIVRTAAQQNIRVRAVGSSWSFSDIAMTPERPPATTSRYVVETSRLDRVLLDTIPKALLAPHATSTDPKYLVHVEAGIQLEKVMTILDRTDRATYTMGGASGQTLAGVISTSVHGSHFRLPPFPDWVRAIHLVGPDGNQHWIEPKDRPITDEAKLREALGPDVQIHYDDDWFDAALVSVGSLGIIYSVVLEVREQYKLKETITRMKWLGPSGLREQLADGRWFTGAADAVQVAIDPGSLRDTDPDCFLSKRVTVPMVTDSTPDSKSFDPLGAFCQSDIILDLLFLAAKELGKPEIIVPALKAVLPTIPAIAALTILFPPVLATLGLVTTIAATSAAAIAGLVGLLKAAGPGAVGDVVGKVLDRHPDLTALVITELTRFAQPTEPPDRTNIAHQIMAPWFKGECLVRGLALEIAIDMGDQSHVQFLDAALAMLKAEAEQGRYLGGYFAIRFVGRSRAILSPQRTAMTCMIEVTGLRTFSSTRPLLNGLEALGRSFGAIQHWGMFEDCRYEDVARGFPRLDTWLRVRNQLTNNGAIKTFDNDFMERCGLIPTAKPKMLLRHSIDGAIHSIYGGAKFHVPDPATLNRLFTGVPLRDAQVGELEHIGTAPGDGTLLQEETTGKVFVIYGGAKFHVPNPPTLTRLFPGFVLHQLWEGAIEQIPDRPADGTLLREENGTIWIIYAGAKFQVPDPDKDLPAYARNSPAMVNNFFGRHISSRGPLRQVWNDALVNIPLIPVDGTFFREETASQYYIIAGGRKSPPPRLRRGTPGRTVHVLWDGALAQIP